MQSCACQQSKVFSEGSSYLLDGGGIGLIESFLFPFGGGGRILFLKLPLPSLFCLLGGGIEGGGGAVLVLSLFESL